MTFKELELAKGEALACGFKVKVDLPLGKYGKSSLAESDKWRIHCKGFGQNVYFSEFAHYELWMERMYEKAE